MYNVPLQDYDPTNPNWEFLKKIHDFQSTIKIQPLSGEEAVSTSSQ